MKSFRHQTTSSLWRCIESDRTLSEQGRQIVCSSLREGRPSSGFGGSFARDCAPSGIAALQCHRAQEWIFHCGLGLFLWQIINLRKIFSGRPAARKRLSIASAQPGTSEARFEQCGTATILPANGL
jgi:hypothetical protein